MKRVDIFSKKIIRIIMMSTKTGRLLSVRVLNGLMISRQVSQCDIYTVFLLILPTLVPLLDVDI